YRTRRRGRRAHAAARTEPAAERPPRPARAAGGSPPLRLREGEPAGGRRQRLEAPEPRRRRAQHPPDEPPQAGPRRQIQERRHDAEPARIREQAEERLPVESVEELSFPERLAAGARLLDQDVVAHTRRARRQTRHAAQTP